MWTQQAAQQAARQKTRRPSLSGGAMARRVMELQAVGTNPRSAMAASLMARRIRHQTLTLRETIFLLVEEPESSLGALFFSILVRTTTLTATAAATFESLDAVSDLIGSLPFFILAYVCNAFFLLEAAMRVGCYMPFRDLFRDPFIYLDLLTVVPFVVRLATHGTSLERIAQGQKVLEACGSIRMLKLCRYYEGASLLARAFSRSFEALVVPLFLLIITITSCSAVRLRPPSTVTHTLRVLISLAKQTASVHSSHYHVCALCAL